MAETERWDGGDRLRQAIERWHGGPEGIEAFVKALKEHGSQTGEKILGANRAMVQRYLGNKAAPSIEFLREAAKVLRVRFSWLAIDDGPLAEEAALLEKKLAVWAAEQQNARVDTWELICSHLPASTPEPLPRAVEAFADPVNHQRRLALFRFALNLDDATFHNAPWVAEGARNSLIGAAAKFLLAVDSVVDTNAAAAPHVLQGATGARGALLTWYNAVLDLFSRKVRGLGVRTGGIYDSEDTPVGTALFEADGEEPPKGDA